MALERPVDWLIDCSSSLAVDQPSLDELLFEQTALTQRSQ
jgi:hypothetical protein